MVAEQRSDDTLKPLIQSKRSEIMKKMRDLQRTLAFKIKQGDTESKENITSKLKELATALNTVQTNRVINYKKRKRLNNKIRFFDLQKVTRRLRQKRLRLAKLENTDDTEQNTEHERNILRQDIEQLQDNLFYIENFPDNKQYISLFLDPQKHDSETLAELEARRCKVLSQLKIKRQAQRQKIVENPTLTDDKSDDFFCKKESTAR